MRKNLVKTLVAFLLAVECICAHSTVTIKDGSILTPSYDFNPSSSMSALLEFQNPASFIGVLPPDPSTLSRLRPSVASATDAILDRIYTTSEQFSDNAEFLLASTANYSQQARALAAFSAGFHVQSVARVSYLTFTVAGVTVGEEPAASPFNFLDTRMLVVDSVADQTRAFLNYSQLLIDELRNIAATFEDLNRLVGGVCNCNNNATVQPLIEAWTALRANVSQFASVRCRKTKLGDRLSEATALQLAAAIRQTADFVGSLDGCVSCLVRASVSFGNFETLASLICEGSLLPTLDGIMSREVAIFAEQTFGVQRYSFRRLTSFVSRFYYAVVQLSDKMSTRKCQSPFKSALGNFEEGVHDTVDIYKKFVLAEIDEWAAATRRSELAVRASLASLAQALEGDIGTCRTCLSLGQDQLLVSVDLEEGLRSCGKIVTRDFLKIERNVTNQLKLYAVEYENVLVRAERCAVKPERSWRCRGSVAMNRRCLEQAARETNQRLTAIAGIVNATAASLLPALNATSQKYEACLDSFTAPIIAKINDGTAALLRCKAILALLPRYSAANERVNEFRQSLANSTADPACLAIIQAQLDALDAAAQEALQNIRTIEASDFSRMIDGMEAAVDQMTAGLKACEDAMKTTTVAVPVSKFPPPNLCATWKPYLNDSGPATDGFSVGTYVDGTEAYVGLGYIESQRSLQPGRLRITADPAVYLSLPNTGYVIRRNVVYLSISPECTCTWEPLSFNTTGAIIAGIIVQEGAVYGTPFFVGRYSVVKGGVTGVTVVRARIDRNNFFSDVNGNHGGFTATIPILACNPNPGAEPQLQPITGAPVTDTLLPNQCLFFGHSLTSANGCFSFTFDANGDAVVRKRGSAAALFSTGTANRAAFQVCLLAVPGNLIVYSLGELVYNSKTSGGTRLVLGNDGNLVLYAANGSKIWESGSAQSDTTC